MFNSLARVLYVPIRFIYLNLALLYLLLLYVWQRNFRPKQFDLSRFYRYAFNLLGGTFIKVGQALSLRYDILSIEQCEALSTLLDEVKPFNPVKGLEMIEAQLKKPLDKLYGSIEKEPFAAASFSQVYKAISLRGLPLAVKVKRPHMDKIVFADTFFLKIIRHLLALLGIGRRLGVPGLIDEIITILRKELDYIYEAKLIQIFEEKSRQIPNYRVPRVLHALSGKNVLTMEFLEGISLRDLMSQGRSEAHSQMKPADDLPIELPELCARVYDITLRTIFETGFFHGDPHPGNIFLMPGGEIGYVDFGIIGMLNRNMRRKNLEYMRCLAQDRIEDAANLYAEILVPTEYSDWDGLKRDMMVELEIYISNIKNPVLAATKKSSVTLYQHSIQLAQKYRFRLPQNVLLYYKALFTVDNILLDLCPQYNAKAETQKFILDHSFRELLEENSFDNTLNRYLELSRAWYRPPDLVGNLNRIIGNLAESQTRPRVTLVSEIVNTLMKAFSRVTYISGVLLLVLRFVFKPQWQWMASMSMGQTLFLTLIIFVMGYWISQQR